ncbi:MAG: hypothetical protein WBQ60_07415 [Asticcacaulis sp.]
MTQQTPAPVKPTGFRGLWQDPRLVAFINYALLFFTVMTFGLSAMVVMLIANFAEDKASDWLKSHYEFQKRTFWYSIVPILLISVFYTFVQRHNMGTAMTVAALVLLLAAMGYTAGRAIMGFNHLMHNRNVPNSKSWLI